MPDPTPVCGAAPCVLPLGHDESFHQDEHGMCWLVDVGETATPAREAATRDDVQALCTLWASDAREELRDRIEAALRTVGLARNLAAYRVAVMAVVEAALAKAEQRYKGIAEGYAIEVRDLVGKLGQAERRVEHFEEHAAQVNADLGIETQRAEHLERERDVAVAAADPFKIERVTSLVAASTRLIRTERDAERQNAEQAEAAVQRVRAAIEAARRPLATTSRDMAIDRMDAWLYAIFLGWDCDDDHEHSDDCDAMTDVAIQHGWTAETVARLREHRSAIAALDQPKDAPPPAHTGGNAETCPVCRPRIDQPGPDGVLYPWICPGAQEAP